MKSTISSKLNFQSQSETSFRRWCIGLLIVVVACRLVSLFLYPLSDETESRYAEIARLMVETGNWVTPQIDYGVPFWAKPPLGTWLSALGIGLLGANEFAVRLPMLGITAAAICVFFLFVRERQGDLTAWAASLVLLTTPLFFVAGAGVMTDPALLFALMLSMAGFYQALLGNERHLFWAYLFFVGLGIGLLAKGPIAIVLTGFPIVLWLFFCRSWGLAWRRLPWFKGCLLAALIALPWYGLAELRSPGFLDYFLVGEHWRRFVEPGWTGDLYGKAHRSPRGFIWVYGFIVVLPWFLGLLGALWGASRRATLVTSFQKNPNWNVYLVCWALSPLLFFSMAGNILWTYVLPGVPAFAALLVGLLRLNEVPARVYMLRVCAIVASLYLVILGFLSVDALAFNRTQKPLIHAYKVAAQNGERLVYLGARPYSAQFYSGGAAQLLEGFSGLDPLFANDQMVFVATRTVDFDRLPSIVRTRLVLEGEFPSGFNLYRLDARP